MKKLTDPSFYIYRIATGSSFGDLGGAFLVASKIDGRFMSVIATVADGWDHVSAARPDRCPLWDEMEQVKRLFFKDDETAMQLHVPVADHISLHPYCLHIWRPHHQDIPRPPNVFIP